MLTVKNLTVQYGSLVIVNNVSFSASPGQWLMIAGPNGAGKSTVINAIAQCVPYTGEVLLNGVNARKMRSTLLARAVGVLTQNHYVGYSFTVEEVVRLGRYAYAPGMFRDKSDGDEEAVEAALEKTGMTKLRKQSVLTLSGGELQRAFLAQVFAQDPQCLLLDEPTNHLDLVYQKQIFRLIEKWLGEKERAVISVVHDLSLARAYGTRGLLLDKGKAVAFGSKEQVFTNENLNAVYGMDVGEWMRTMLKQWENEDK